MYLDYSIVDDFSGIVGDFSGTLVSFLQIEAPHGSSLLTNQA